MSGIGVLPITSDQNPTPQLPGQVTINSPKVQPGSTQAAPIVPSAAPPNVTGGSASFSDVTSAIKDLVTAKTSELSASADALKANTSVDASAAAAISGLSTQTLHAYDNVQKANSLPGGAGGKLAHIIGIFDSDYNVAYQDTAIKQAQLRASQVSATAEALKQQNNALPALLSKVSEAQKTIFDAQKDANDLVLKQGTLQNEQLRTRIEKARLGIELNVEARNSANFRIEKMSTDQLTAALPQAQAGKGPLAGMAGLIEHRLVSEESALTSLQQGQLALKKGNREEYNQSNVDFVSHLPTDFTSGLLRQAQASGSPVVSFNVGKDPKTGAPLTQEIPINLVQQGLVQSAEQDKKANEYLAADYSQRLNIGPSATNIMNTANAFAGIDPRATQIVTNLGHVMQNLNPKDPSNVRQTGLLLQPLKASMDKVVADQAAKMPTPEAKAAMLAFGETGRFDSVGGTAVTVASAGNPSLNMRGSAKFSKAWNNFNTQIATQIQQEHLVQGGPNIAQGNVDSSSAMALISQMMAKQGGREKITAIAQNILADPIKAKELTQQVKGTLQADTLNGTISQLAHQKDADPIWKNIMDHSEQFTTGGKFDPAKLFTQLESMSVRSGGKINYAQSMLSGLGNYAVNANNSPSSDPSYTYQDHGLVAALFGANPGSHVAGDLHFQLRQLATRVKQEMNARINQDVTGQTTQQAIKQTNVPIPLDLTENDPQYPQNIFKKTGVDINQVPSATGTGLTVNQVKAMYPGGAPK